MAGLAAGVSDRALRLLFAAYHEPVSEQKAMSVTRPEHAGRAIDPNSIASRQAREPVRCRSQHRRARRECASAEPAYRCWR